MNRKFSLLWTIPLLLGASAAWAQEEEPMLPDPADDEARAAAQLPDAAAEGLAIAGEQTAGLPAEATIRLIDGAEDDDGIAVTHEVELPELPPEGAAGQQGLDIADQAINGRDDFGHDMAGDAIDDAIDNAHDLAEDAQDAAESRGRAEDLPVDVPGQPDVPDFPTPPTG